MATKKTFRILISVYDKSHLIDFVKELNSLFKLEIISSGGTSTHLTEAGFDVNPVESVTDFPEILGGRVKTLHPKIHGGLLADRQNPMHMKELQKLEIQTFDMIVVNLYPFEETVGKADVTREEAIEQIDIGGVTILRAAAKNFTSVIPICDIDDYGKISQSLAHKPSLTENHRKTLAAKVFEHTSCYDRAISEYLASA